MPQLDLRVLGSERIEWELAFSGMSPLPPQILFFDYCNLLGKTPLTKKAHEKSLTSKSKV
jgi:hypothetical protein